MQYQNRPCRMSKCFICEESLGKNLNKFSELRDYYLYLCSYCEIETSYCFKCSKAIDIILGSMYFKCVSCLYLIKITSRQTFFHSPDDDLLLAMFCDREDARLAGNYPKNPLNRLEVGNSAIVAQNFQKNSSNNFTNPALFFKPNVLQDNSRYTYPYNNNQANNLQGLFANSSNQTNNQQYNFNRTNLAPNMGNRFDNNANNNFPKPQYNFNVNQCEIDTRWKKDSNFNQNHFDHIDKPIERGKFCWNENRMNNPIDNNNVQMSTDIPEFGNFGYPKKENENVTGKNFNFISSLKHDQYNDGSFTNTNFNSVNVPVFQNNNFIPFQANNTPKFNSTQTFNFIPNPIRANDTNQNPNLILQQNNTNIIPSTHHNSFDSFLNNNIMPNRQSTNNDRLLSVQNDPINIPQMEAETSMTDNEKLPNFSVLQSKSSRTDSKNYSATVHKLCFKKINSEFSNKNSSSEFAGFNKEESTLWSKSTLTPKYIVKNRDHDSLNRLNQSDIITTERNSYLSGSIPDLNNSSNQINLNNTISHFNN